MKRKTIIMFAQGIKRSTAMILIFIVGLSCGNEEHHDSNQQPSSADQSPKSCVTDKTEDEIRLKGVGLLGRSFADVLGTKKDKNIANPNERLFETYRENFGGNEGLGYGDIYADHLTESQMMTAYFLALNIVAYNAALQCQNGSVQELCRCDDLASAEAMLSRALPTLESCEEHQSLVFEFSQLCQENYIYAVTSLMSSVAVAKRH